MSWAPSEALAAVLARNRRRIQPGALGPAPAERCQRSRSSRPHHRNDRLEHVRCDVAHVSFQLCVARDRYAGDGGLADLVSQAGERILQRTKNVRSAGRSQFVDRVAAGRNSDRHRTGCPCRPDVTWSVAHYIDLIGGEPFV